MIGVIESFRCADTETLRNGYSVLRFKAFEESARTRLRRLDAATTLQDLIAIRGNRLEALKGDRRGQYSIRINDQWRICFKWKDGRAQEVEIVDYH
jgi:proteic killer suppression protein